MIALEKADFITIEDYLSGEEFSGVKHEYSGSDPFQDRPIVIVEVLSDSAHRTGLGEKRDAYLTISPLKLLIFVEPDSPVVTLHRRRPEGGFATERYSGLEATIPLPEIDASLPLADLYERVSP